MINYTIVELNDSNISSIEELVEESIAEGYTLGRRMRDEWKSGENTFSKKGEKGWGLFHNAKCIAIGSINIDPYFDNNDGTVGRVRHVYVMREFRGQGFSKLLMQIILDHAKKYFKIVRLATSNPTAMRLYESFGFTPTGEKRKDKPIYSISLKPTDINI